MVDASALNPLSSIGIGTIGWSLLIFAIAIVVVLLIGGGVWYYVSRKRLKYTIPLHKKIGNRVIRVATYKAQDFKISRAGDKLWYVPKAKKFIACATLQTAPNEYTHFERADGEWINIDYPDIDEIMKKAGVKYVASDMRAQRIAISDILDNRFKDKKTWWEKYGHLVTHLIFYCVVCICMVVIFWQWSDIVDKTSTVFDKVVAYEKSKCATTQGVVPAFFPLLLWRFKKWTQ